MLARRSGGGEEEPDNDFWPWEPQDGEEPSQAQPTQAPVGTMPTSAPAPRASTQDVLPVIGGRRVDRRVAPPSLRADERRRTPVAVPDRPIVRPAPRRVPPTASMRAVADPRRLASGVKRLSRRSQARRGPGPDASERRMARRDHHRLMDVGLLALAILVVVLALLALTRS